MTKRSGQLLIMLIACLMVFCLFFASCRTRADEESSTETETAAVEEQAADTVEEVAETADETESQAESSGQVTDEQSKEDKKETKKNTKSEKKAKNQKKSSSSSSKKEKKKVWVEPVTETRTVTLDTGTRYCNGANSGGGCGASWHGTKDGTYSQWKSHWQAYVKKRTEEEAAKGNTYVCDHIHDDSRWVADTTTEEVVIKEGYWKEVD